MEPLVAIPTSLHPDHAIATAREPQGDGKSAHFCIENVVGCSIVHLPTVPETTRNRSECTYTRRCDKSPSRASIRARHPSIFTEMTLENDSQVLSDTNFDSSSPAPWMIPVTGPNSLTRVDNTLETAFRFVTSQASYKARLPVLEYLEWFDRLQAFSFSDAMLVPIQPWLPCPNHCWQSFSL